MLTTGLQTYNADLGLLAAGDYTLSIGGLNNKKTWSTEGTSILIDDVLIAGTATSPAAASNVAGADDPAVIVETNTAATEESELTSMLVVA